MTCFSINRKKIILLSNLRGRGRHDKGAPKGSSNKTDLLYVLIYYINRIYIVNLMY